MFHRSFTYLVLTKTMKYILSDKYALRGYFSGEQQVLLNLLSGEKIHISKSMSEILKLCNGKTDFDSFFFFPSLKKNAELAFKQGWVVNADSGAVLRPEQTYRELSVPAMQIVHWSVTGRCNAKCRHCCAAESQQQHKDLEYNEMLKVLDELAENEIYRIVMTGGEPLLRPDLPSLLKEMAKRKIKVAAVSTNGFLLTEKVLGLFAENGMQPLYQISFDGVGHHDWIRGIEGAEELAVSAMDVCRRNNTPFDVSMCVHRGNLHLVPETVRLAADHGARRIRIGPVQDVGGFSKENGIELISFVDSFEYYLTYLPEFIKTQPDILLSLAGLISIHGKHPEDYENQLTKKGCINPLTNRICTIAEDNVYITDEGRLLPCMTLIGMQNEKDFYSLASHSLGECVGAPAYRNMLNLCADELLRHNPQCKACEYFSCCGGGCRGIAYSKSGNQYGLDRDVCSVFRDRWLEKLVNVVDSCLK